MSADVVGYTRLMHEDEEGTLARLHAISDSLIEPKISQYKGRIVKLLGDGWLVEFTSVIDAIRCATDIQRDMATRAAGEAEHDRLVLRVGVNLGDVIVEGDDIYGDGVNVATRMQEIAAPGGISVSGIVYDSVKDRLAPSFEDLGPQHVKNIAEPVRAYRVVLDPEGRGGSAKAPQTGGAPHPKTAPQPTGSQASHARTHGSVYAVMSSSQRRGSWQVPEILTVVAVMGSIDLDLRDAHFGPGVTEIKTTNVMGSIDISVPDDVMVECDGIGFMGQFDEKVRRTPGLSSASPVVRVSGLALMGQTIVS